MNGLILHCGSEIKSREEVFSIPTPLATESYVPLSYESLVTRIEKQLAVEGIKITSEKLALGRNGQRMFGLMELEMPELPRTDYAAVLGFRNSYDRSTSTGIVLGASVLVCDNLSFSGDMKFERKHTAGLLKDLTWIIAETVSALPAKFAAQSKTFEVYKETPLTDRQVHDLLIQFYDRRAINVTHIPGLLQEWREPRHPEFIQAGKTAWRLFNAATETLKGDVWRLSERTRSIHEILDAECSRKGSVKANIPIEEWAEDNGDVPTHRPAIIV